MNKKILVLSHNAFSKFQNNGKTLESFFPNYSPGNVAQIYLQPEQPDFEFCNTYFRITDYEALNNFIFNGELGHEIKSIDDNNQFIQKTHKFVRSLYPSGEGEERRLSIRGLLRMGFVNRLPVLVSFRELIWLFAKWRSPRLKKWIEEFSPDVLFFQGSSCSFAYKIANWISENYKLPIILQLTDDYTEVTYRYSIFDFINKYIYCKNLASLIEKATAVLTISDYMKSEYEMRFDGRFITLMNSIQPRAINIEYADNSALRFLYAGNVQIGRWKILKIIGKAIFNINEKHGSNHTLFIHSPIDLSAETYAELSSVPTIKIGKRLCQQELEEAISESNILVHVESFDRKMRLVTRLSISTKIPEYMAAKRAIFALGPSDVASIKYLKDNNIAHVMCSTNEFELIGSIMQLVNDEQKRKKMADLAYSIYLQRHTSSNAINIIENIVQNSTGA
jgi:hypothetical protein